MPEQAGDRASRTSGGAAAAGSDRGEPRFAVDCMLGTLAKWLKILGYDTLYLNKVEDAVLVDRARAEGRILLTRDRKMTERRQARPFLLIDGERALDQLRQVAAAFGLEPSPARMLTRCLPCNVPTCEIDRTGAEGRVPLYVYRTQPRFRSCPSCGRVYWGATHRDRILERLRNVFDDAQR